MTEQELDWLAEHIVRDRFLPCPPPDRIFVGDGAFLPIGAEFLKWFVRLGGLAPYERVLDLGCGIGRMAVPLTQYLEAGSYDGVDIVSEGISWCTQNITSRYENFRFHRLDLAHAIYNPSGKQATKDLRLPFKDAAFDFVFMTSVVPHLHADERHLRQCLYGGQAQRLGQHCRSCYGIGSDDHDFRGTGQPAASRVRTGECDAIRRQRCLRRR